ncbi:unnamed protein product [Caenorhabditis nigoni]
MIPVIDNCSNPPKILPSHWLLSFDFESAIWCPVLFIFQASDLQSLISNSEHHCCRPRSPSCQPVQSPSLLLSHSEPSESEFLLIFRSDSRTIPITFVIDLRIIHGLRT